jgi:hypothetical protein
MQRHQCQSEKGGDTAERRVVSGGFDRWLSDIEVPALHISMDAPALFD